MDSNFKKIDYAGGTAHIVINASMRDAILCKLQKYYHLQLFPRGHQPYRKTYLKLSSGQTNLRHDYLIRYLLNIEKSYIYTTVHNGTRFCFHIVYDKGVALYSVKHRFSEDLFQGDMLLEGSLIDTRSPLFLVDDIIVYDGRTVDLYLEDKLKLLNEIMDTKYRPDPVMDPCTVMLADHIEAKYFSSFMEEYLQTLPYKQYVEGVVFVPLGKSQTNLTCKILPQAGVALPRKASHSIVVADPRVDVFCFSVEKTGVPDVYSLYVSDGAKLIYYDQACVPDKATSLKLHNMFRAKGTVIMTCHYNNTFKRWIPSTVSTRKKPDDVKLL